jgi:hypothetical protein
MVTDLQVEIQNRGFPKQKHECNRSIATFGEDRYIGIVNVTAIKSKVVPVLN